MRRIASFVVLLAAVGAAAGLAWRLTRHQNPAGDLSLYGNVDLRQVQLAFDNNGRVAAVLVQEGDRVRQGQVLARLDTARLQPQVAEAKARVDAQRHFVEKLKNGSRPEEIDRAEAEVAAQRHVVEKLKTGSRPEEIEQARANVESAQAEAAYARRQFDRMETLFSRAAATQEDLDDARAALAVAEAKLVVSQRALDLALAGPRQEEIAEAEALLVVRRKTLELTVAGPRQEEIAEAEAGLRASEAQLALLREQLADARLIAPVGGVVRTRILEAGEMASPQKPVFSLAITDPKWVRAYVSEPDLGKLQPGMAAAVLVDSFPGRRFDGWVGFISPVAEFTPKAVQTEELRTSLVYEVRIFVNDPSDELRLGMPATVRLSPGQRRPPMKKGDKNEKRG
ncbi:MAG: efflux RND transporter periplasmic adaptor subunit [Pirellulales bacterium]